MPQRTPYFLVSFLFVLLLSSAGLAQSYSINYKYRFEPARITEPPVIPSFPEIVYPESARKNGVEGTVTVTLTLTEKGTVSDINVAQGLPNGVTEAVVEGMKKLQFTPAKYENSPVPLKMTMDYIVAIVFSEQDTNIKKPLITDKPAPVYPENKRAEKLKGKVAVQIRFNADGTLDVAGANSVLPKEFDKAALEAAQKIKFQPATHKKSKKPVTQVMLVEYDFKP